MFNRKLLFACFGMVALVSASLAYEVPFPKTSYEAIGKTSSLPEQPEAVLFVLIDETTKLNQHHKIYKAVPELAVNWLSPGRAVQVIRFSAYVRERSAEVVTGGLVDPKPSDDFINSLKRSQRNQFNKLYKRQARGAKLLTAKAIRRVFDSHNEDIPKSEILFNLYQLSAHIRDYQAGEKVILLVSDMLENSVVSNFYQSGEVRKIDPTAEIEKAKNKGLIGDFGNAVRVYVVGLGYGVEEYLDSDRVELLKAFWRQYFAQGNANVEEFGTPLLFSGLDGRRVVTVQSTSETDEAIQPITEEKRQANDANAELEALRAAEEKSKKATEALRKEKEAVEQAAEVLRKQREEYEKIAAEEAAIAVRIVSREKIFISQRVKVRATTKANRKDDWEVAATPGYSIDTDTTKFDFELISSDEGCSRSRSSSSLVINTSERIVVEVVTAATRKLGDRSCKSKTTIYYKENPIN